MGIATAARVMPFPGQDGLGRDTGHSLWRGCRFASSLRLGPDGRAQGWLRSSGGISNGLPQVSWYLSTLDLSALQFIPEGVEVRYVGLYRGALPRFDVPLDPVPEVLTVTLSFQALSGFYDQWPLFYSENRGFRAGYSGQHGIRIYRGSRYQTLTNPAVIPDLSDHLWHGITITSRIYPGQSHEFHVWADGRHAGMATLGSYHGNAVNPLFYQAWVPFHNFFHTNRILTGRARLFLLHDRFLSDREIRLLHSDPHCLWRRRRLRFATGATPLQADGSASRWTVRARRRNYRVIPYDSPR